jgi:hypothetical protein
MVLKLFVLEADIILGISKDKGINPRKLIQLYPTTPCNGLLFNAGTPKCVVDPVDGSFSREIGEVFLIKNTYLKRDNPIALLIQSIRACTNKGARVIIVQLAKNPPTASLMDKLGNVVDNVLSRGESNPLNVKWVQFLSHCSKLQQLSELRIPVCFRMEVPFELLVSYRTFHIQVGDTFYYI